MQSDHESDDPHSMDSSVSGTEANTTKGTTNINASVTDVPATAAAPKSSPAKAAPAGADAKTVKAMEDTLAMQERIIAALEADNKRLVLENKKFRDAVKANTHNTSGRIDPSPMESGQPLQPRPAAPTKQLDTSAAALWNPDHATGPSVPKAFMDSEIKKLVQRHDEDMKDMARKVAWYVDHQEFNRAQDALVSEQQATIHELRARLMELEALCGRPGVAVRTDKDKHIRMLQQRVVELEDALKDQKPNSLTDLIRACRPPVHEQRAYRALEQQLLEANAKRIESERAANMAIDRLRVESDGMRVQYASKLEKVEEELKRRLVDTQTRKVKELEKALADTRKTYGEKLKALEHANLALRRGVPVDGRPQQSTAAAQRRGNDDVDADDRGEGLNRSRSQSPKPPIAPATSGKGTSRRAGVDDEGAEATDEGSARRDAVTLRSMLLLERDNAELRGQLDAMRGELTRLTASQRVSGQPDVASSLQAQAAYLQSELALHQRLLREAQDALRQLHVQHEDRVYALRNEALRTADAMRREHADAVASLQERHQQDIANLRKSADSHSGRLREMLATRASAVSKRDAQQYLIAVAERLDAIEREEALREIEFQRVTSEARRLADAELAIERQHMDLELRKKNQEIMNFQAQLDCLLSEVASLAWRPAHGAEAHGVKTSA